MLDCCADGSVNKESVIEDADSIAIKFRLAPCFCLIDIGPIADDEIRFTCP